MPIPVQSPITTHTANGVAREFAFSFTILEARDIVVRAGGVVVTSGFSLAGIGSRYGGSVIFAAPPPALTEIMLTREVSLERKTDYLDNGDLRADTLDNDFDRIWMAIQDQLLITGRSVRAPAGEQLGEMPAASVRALTVLGFDSFGNPVPVTRTQDGGSALALNLAATGGADLVGFGAGTVADSLAALVLGTQSVVGSVAALKALDKTKFAAAFLTGYYASGDGGGCGPVYLDAADTSTADDGVTVFVGADGGRWKRLRLETITTKECGCKADGTTADDVAMARFMPAVIAKRAKGLISPGVHKLNSTLTWDIGAGRGFGLDIEGSGLSVSVLDLRSVSSGAPFLLTSSTGSAFYWGFKKFSVLTSVAGVGARIGKADLSDEFNAFRFDSIELKNTLNHANAVSVDLAGLYQPLGNLIANGGASKGLGVAITLSRVQFGHLTIAAGNAGVGVKFVGSFNFANNFDAIDAEEVATGVLLTGSSQNKNTISSGTIVADVCVDSQLDNSSDDFIIGAGVNLAPYAGGVRLGGTNKLHVRTLDNLITTPAFPASGVTVTNTTGQTAFVTIYNGSVNTVTVNGTAMTNSPAGSVLTQILANGDTIKIDYTGSPGWVWRGGLF